MSSAIVLMVSRVKQIAQLPHTSKRHMLDSFGCKKKVVPAIFSIHRTFNSHIYLPQGKKKT